MSEQELLSLESIIQKYINLKHLRAEKTSFLRHYFIQKITTINFDFYSKRTQAIKELVL